jgi:hypothetical protein
MAAYTVFFILEGTTTMIRKIALVLMLAVVFAGIVFPQSDYGDNLPLNSVGIDIGPLIAGAFIGSVLSDAAKDSPGVNTFGLGIAAQYERQISSYLTVGIKLGYLGFGIGISETGTDEWGNQIKATLGINLNSFNVEGHVRFYPLEGAFFLDFMLGYGWLAPTFSGEAIYKENGKTKKERISITTPRHYLTYGSKTGWRIDFGSMGGLYFEPSFGWYENVSKSPTFSKALKKHLNKEEVADSDFGDGYDEMFNFLENVLFIGGPRLAVVFGWRF